MNTDKGYALITGASQGIGASIAMELARKGFGVLLVARNMANLDRVMKEASALNGGRAKSFEADLLAGDAPERVVAWVKGLNVELTCVVNNAGQGLWGMFAELALEDQLRMMRLNMDVPVKITHGLLPLLRKARKAYILNISSMVAYHALATFALYSGSKAFVLRWSRSLRLELKGTPISVTCVCPGSVITGFTERAGMQAMDDLAKKFGTGPEPVAATAVNAMLNGKAEVVPGLLNRITSAVQGWLPEGLNERVASGIYLKRLPR